MTSQVSEVSKPARGRIRFAQGDVDRAEEDYQRLRSAFLELTRQENGHEVALAMIGADMERAHARWQALGGGRQAPFSPEPTLASRLELMQITEANS